MPKGSVSLSPFIILGYDYSTKVDRDPQDFTEHEPLRWFAFKLTHLMLLEYSQVIPNIVTVFFSAPPYPGYCKTPTRCLDQAKVIAN